MVEVKVVLVLLNYIDGICLGWTTGSRKARAAIVNMLAEYLSRNRPNIERD
jgi:hypothetical protein